MLLNLITISIIIIILVVLFILITNKNSKENSSFKYTTPEIKSSFEELSNHVKETINSLTRSNLHDLALSENEFQKLLNKRTELKKSFKNCIYGSTSDKEYVKDIIYDIIQKHIDINCLDSFIPFNNYIKLKSIDKFDIIMYQYIKLYKYDALKTLIEKYNLDCEKENDNEKSYAITDDDIDKCFLSEDIFLTSEDKLKIITQRVYRSYKGLGVIDDIRDMNIDGVSGGVSGCSDFYDNPNIYKDYQITNAVGLNSIWIFYKGKTIHLKFLSFESTNELRRICQNIYRYNKAGQLSENIGYRVNEMADGSRVLVVRPPFSESWAFFVRKFHIKNVTLNQIIVDENNHLPIELIKYLAKGARITAVTGQQGSGKTTLLMAMIKHIYNTLTLRVQEMDFELNLRKLYPNRNILSFRETAYITGQEGLDIQKKTDGAVNILGEIATDSVAAWMIQMSQVASLFTLFTHHAKTARDLVLSLRNSLLKCEVFHDENTAEQQVASVLDFNIHLRKDPNGKRYIERITEIIEIDNDIPYPNNTKYSDNINDKLDYFTELAKEYFKRVTDRKIFDTRNIVEYKDGKYVAVNVMSEKSITEMKKNMRTEDTESFNNFLKSYWGVSV